MKIFWKKLGILIGDIIFLYFSLVFALFLRHKFSFQIATFLKNFFFFSLVYFIWIVTFYVFNLYELEFFKRKIALKIILAMLFNFVVAVILFYFLPFLKITPKTILLLNVILFGILAFFWRQVYFSIFLGHFKKRVLLLGENKEILELKKKISENPYLGYELVEINSQDNLWEKIQKEKVQKIVFSREFKQKEKFEELFLRALSLNILVEDFVDFFEEVLEKIPLSQISYFEFLRFEKEEGKIIYDKTKRLLDIFLASFILILSLPLWLIIAILIKMEDGGPIFYKQKRVGKLGKVFEIIKFRSMSKEAEKDEPRWAEKNDKRATKVGRVLRKFHLDELPQMINVLKGEISLVGPRPERPEFVEKLAKEIPYFNLRHIIKPGFTGWAQIKFRYARSVMDSFEKFQYDLYYIKNRSPLLDLKILLKTFQLFFKQE